VRAAFAVGWQVGELLQLAHAYAGSGNGASPGDEEPDGERTQLNIEAVKAGVCRLRPHLEEVDLPEIAVPPAIDAAATASALAEAGDDLNEFDAQLRNRLNAADFRLGKGYRLGRELAETCLNPETRDEFDHAFGTRMVDVRDRLADLATVLPPHASRAVALSIRTWERWAAEPSIDGRAVVWEREWPAVRAALRRQGQLWRALLSGEKDGRDMLRVDDYLDATARLLRKTTRLMFGGVRSPLVAGGGVVLIVILIGVGVFLFASGDTNGTRGAGGLLTALGALGLTGAGVRRAVSSTAAQLQQWLWNGELDFSIAEAITIGPPEWGAPVEVELAASGAEPTAAEHLKTLAKFRDALRGGKRTRIAELLAHHVDFEALPHDFESKPSDATFSSMNWRPTPGGAGDGMRRAAHPVSWARRPKAEYAAPRGQDPIPWLLQHAEGCKMTEEPKEVVGGEAGKFVVYLGDELTHFWRVREGKVRAWRAFDDRDAARAYAGLGPVVAEPEPAPAGARQER
jgi:hypothetical protein